MAKMATTRREGKQFRTAQGIDALSGVHATPAHGAAGPLAAELADGAAAADSPDPISHEGVGGDVVVTFDPTLVVADEQTTPDLDAREARTRTKRRPKGPDRKPTRDAVVDAPPPNSPPPSDPS
jgi:hypothetical protein